MTNSFVDLVTPMDSENAVIGCLINAEEGSGFITVEFLDEKHNHLLYCIGRPLFAREYEIFCVPEGKSIRKALCDGSAVSRYRISKETLTNLSIWNQIQSEHKIGTPNYLSYSSIKAEKGLKSLFGFEFSSEDPTFHSSKSTEEDESPKSWNPFARIMESNFFPLARLHRSTWWKRVQDTFFILNGDFISNERLGILDYLFPLSKLLLTMASLESITPIISGFLYILGFGAFAIKTFVTTLLTLALLPVISIVDLGFKFSALFEASEDNSLVVLDLYDDQQHYEDLSSFAKTHKVLSIRPLARNDQVEYVLLSESRGIGPNETLVLGLFSEGDPSAFIEMSTGNKHGLFSLMKNNAFHIDENLEQSHMMEQVLTYVKSS